MGKIKIIHDPEGVYKDCSIQDIKDMITSYCDCCNDKSLIDYLYRIPIPSAIAFLWDAWAIEYEYV
jgi:hypothetical protein